LAGRDNTKTADAYQQLHIAVPLPTVIGLWYLQDVGENPALKRKQLFGTQIRLLRPLTYFSVALALRLIGQEP